MKFEKVLIALYSLLQILLAASLYIYDALTPHYAVFTALTLLFFALTHFRDVQPTPLSPATLSSTKPTRYPMSAIN